VVKVLAERGEARDYLDVKTIDEKGGILVEEGIEHYLERYPVESTSAVLKHLVRAPGDPLRRRGRCSTADDHRGTPENGGQGARREFSVT
jgi:hypothetical protein